MKQLSPEKRFSEALLQIARTQSLGTVFDDFLDFALLFIRWWDLKDEHFSDLEKKYPDKDLWRLFAEAYLAMADIADHNGAGFKDPFGDFYMEHLYQSATGQFFTPEPICDFMAHAQITAEMPDKATVYDPCCGSGRLLLSAGKINRLFTFYAADVDLTCCKMTVLNFLLNTMCGEVAWMDSLSLKYYRGWKTDKVMLDNGFYLPCYRVITADESELAMKSASSVPPAKSAGTDTPLSETPVNTTTRRKPKPPTSQLILDFG